MLGPAGAKVVVAQSFARIFFRNCVATCGPSDCLGSARVRVRTLFVYGVLIPHHSTCTPLCMYLSRPAYLRQVLQRARGR